MTLTISTRRTARNATSAHAPLVVLRQTRFCTQPGRDRHATPKLRWIGDLVVRR